MKRLLLLLPLLAAAQPVEASIYADLFARTVTGRNDGSADLVITDGTENVMTVSEAAKTPPGTTGMKPNEKLTVPMNRAGFRYYNNQFKRLQSLKLETLNTRSLQKGGDNSWNSNQCPPGTRVYRKTALFGLIKGKEICLSDYEAESLNARQIESLQENIRNMETQRRLENLERQVRFNDYPIIIP
jgi:hypothetical protein